MKVKSDPVAHQQALEAAQRYHSLTFTAFGELLLNVRSVTNGRITLMQEDQRLRLLPETIHGIHLAWQEGSIPPEGCPPWEVSTSSLSDSKVDDVRCVCVAPDQIRIADKRSPGRIVVSREQMDSIMTCIVEPWLVNFSDSSAPKPECPAKPVAPAAGFDLV